MKKQKKANNIFEKQVLPQSLFHQEVQKEYRVGGVKIQGGWLSGTSPQLYRVNLKSSLQLIQLHQQLAQLKKRSKDSNMVDMFRIAALQKQTQNFQLLQMSPRKQHKSNLFTLKVEDLILQKLSDYWGSFQRQCRLQQTILHIKSQKQKKYKDIDLIPYKMQLEQKILPLQISKKFEWIGQHLMRICLHGQKLRTYCLYGEQRCLREIVRKNKIRELNMNKTSLFKELNNHYFSKSMIAFGNRLRSFQYFTKQQQQRNLHNAYDLIEKTNILEIHSQQQKKITESQLHTPKMSVNDPEQSSNLSYRRGNIGSPHRGALNQSSIFRLRSRRSTIHYDQLQKQDAVFQSPQYGVQNISLGLHQVVSQQFLSQNDSKISQQKSQLQSMRLESNQTPLIQFLKVQQQQIDSQGQLIQDFDLEEDSISNRKSSGSGFERSIKSSKHSRFQIYSTEITHHLHIGYYQQFFPYPKKQIELQIYQINIPDYEYQNMKIPVVDFQQITLIRQSTTNRFTPHFSFPLKCSKKYTQFVIQIKHGQFNPKHFFCVDLNQIYSVFDHSQFLYLKQKKQNQYHIYCAGKLKIAICSRDMSPDLILKQQSTVQFLKSYICNNDSLTKKKKHKFIDYKHKDYEIRQQWHQKLMRKIIHKKDYKQFAKIIYFANSQKFIEKANSLISSSTLGASTGRGTSLLKSYNIQQKFLIPLDKQLENIEAIIIKKTYPAHRLISVMKSIKKNTAFQLRYNSIQSFIRLKYGTQGVSKLIGALTLQIIKKLQSILKDAKDQASIKQIFKQYFEVQYELDELFSCISAYFQ